MGGSTPAVCFSCSGDPVGGANVSCSFGGACAGASSRREGARSSAARPAASAWCSARRPQRIAPRPASSRAGSERRRRAWPRVGFADRRQFRWAERRCRPDVGLTPSRKVVAESIGRSADARERDEGAEKSCGPAAGRFAGLPSLCQPCAAGRDRACEPPPSSPRAPMLGGRFAGSGCSIAWMSGRIAGSMSERSGTTLRFAIASTSVPLMSIGRPRSVAASTRPRL